MDSAEAVILEIVPDRPASRVETLLKRVCPCLSQNTQTYHVHDARITREPILRQPESHPYSPETRIVQFSNSKSTHHNSINQTRQPVPIQYTMRRATEPHASRQAPGPV